MNDANRTTSLEPCALLIGRVLLAAIFLHDGLFKLGNYALSGAYARSFGVPEQLLPLAIVVEIGGSLLIALGLYTRVCALLLAGFCMFTAIVFHTKFGDRNQLIHFEKNVAMAGGFLVLWVTGAGRLSIARLLNRSEE